MKNLKERIELIFSNRELIIVIITYIIGTVYISTLFDMQVIKGKTYRESSSKKLVRTEIIEAARGEIYDTNGVVLATNKVAYNAVIYKTSCDYNEQNRAILAVYNILIKNGDKISSSFPLNEEGNAFTFLGEENEKKWKKDIGIKENATLDEVIEYYKEKYALEEYSYEDAIKVIRIKYEANLYGYSLFNYVVIAKNLSDASVAEINEYGYTSYGIETKTKLERYYPFGESMAATIRLCWKNNF